MSESKVVAEAMRRMGYNRGGASEATGSFGAICDFIAGAAYMAELFAAGQGALRETLEAIRADLEKLRRDKEGLS